MIAAVLSALLAAAGPTPIAAAAPCNRDPAVVSLARPGLTAADYALLKTERQAVVAVTLDANAHVTNAMVYQSSGDANLDAAAIAAAKASTYAAGSTNCAPSGGTFGVTFLFEPTVTAGSCAVPNRDAAALHEISPEWPRGMSVAHPMTTTVRVTIGTSGTPPTRINSTIERRDRF